MSLSLLNARLKKLEDRRPAMTRMQKLLNSLPLTVGPPSKRLGYVPSENKAIRWGKAEPSHKPEPMPEPDKLLTERSEVSE